jgi:hypothetical protein
LLAPNLLSTVEGFGMRQSSSGKSKAGGGMLPEIEMDEDLIAEPLKKTKKEWQICQHFEESEDPMEIVEHYKNFNALVVFCGMILCETCYQRLMEGKHQQVFESCSEIKNEFYRQILGSALLKANQEMQAEL